MAGEQDGWSEEPWRSDATSRASKAVFQVLVVNRSFWRMLTVDCQVEQVLRKNSSAWLQGQQCRNALAISRPGRRDQRKLMYSKPPPWTTWRVSRKSCSFFTTLYWRTCLLGIPWNSVCFGGSRCQTCSCDRFRLTRFIRFAKGGWRGLQSNHNGYAASPGSPKCPDATRGPGPSRPCISNELTPATETAMSRFDIRYRAVRKSCPDKARV